MGKISSDYVIWLSVYNGGVIGIDYRELNDYIYEFNKGRYYRYCDFWNWLSYECFEDEIQITGLSALDQHNLDKLRRINA